VKNANLSDKYPGHNASVRGVAVKGETMMTKSGWALGARRLAIGAAAMLGMMAVSATALAQSAIKADITVQADKPGATINPEIYGQFAEHLGRSIYEGLWVGPDSPIPNTRGLRNDVVEALRRMKVPVLRWPGGCFADEYDWRDGIGPRDKRPVRVNTTWGGVGENNAFGTHEFFDLVEMLGTKAYVSGNLGTGTPREMAQWIEYMTAEGNSTLAQERRKNGRDKPWKLDYFGIGNETWGCGGNMKPEYSADLHRRYVTFVRKAGGKETMEFASGANDKDVNFTEVMMRDAGKFMDGLTLHYYTLPTGDWKKKGAATQFDEGEWISTLSRTLEMDHIIQAHAAVMDKYDPEKKVGLIVDEWGTWYDVEPGTNPGFLYQQNTLRDAVVGAVNFHIFQAHADRVRMANIAQMVNVLQSMILTDKERMLLTPTYHVFEMFNVHQGATYIPVSIKAPEYAYGDFKVPSVHAGASRDAAGKLHLTLANLDPNRPASVSAKLEGVSARKVEGRILTAPAMNSHNSFAKPDVVKPVAFNGAKVKGDTVTIDLPAKSVVVLELR